MSETEAVTERRRVPAVTLGRSGLASSKIGLGSANWIGRVPDAEFLALLREAFRLGIRHLDTAPLYQQARFGRLLAEAEPPDDVLVVTKIGRFRTPEGSGTNADFAPDLIERTVERNLRELQLARLPVVLCHDCRAEQVTQILARGGALDVLRRFQAQGLIGAVGIAAGYPDAVALAAESGEFDIIQSFHLYTLLSREATRRLFPAARQHHLGVINIGPFAGNILATGAVEGARYSYVPAAPEVLQEVRRMEQACAQRGVSLPAAALACSLACPDIHVTVIGPVSIAELREDVAALALPLTAADWQAIASPVDYRPAWRQ